jgi:uncharacterized ferritin-like protein (DUF455 family)
LGYGATCSRWLLTRLERDAVEAFGQTDLLKLKPGAPYSADRHDAAARLAVVPLVLEARGLDVSPQMIVRLNAFGDRVSSRILARIYSDEIQHVATGVKWFESSARASGRHPPEQWRELVARHFGGALKPPFNDLARSSAGLTPEFYGSLAPAEASRQT